MTPALVDGPAWAMAGVHESSGAYPLRVETAVKRLVEKLLPGVITTTTQARYYALHTLAWSEVQDRGLEGDEAHGFVRRCEVVMAAAYRQCREHNPAHVASLPAAHGEDLLPRFTRDGTLALSDAAARGGFSKGGFADTYKGSEQALRLLTPGQAPRRGPRALLGPLRAGLGDALELADQDELDSGEQLQAQHLCPCRAAAAPDGDWLRRVMFEEADPEVEGDRNRQLTCGMLLDALDDPARDVEQAFRAAHGFGYPINGGDLDAKIRRSWRAAILRNYSVSAWRHLWRWVSLQLVHEERSRRGASREMKEAPPMGGASSPSVTSVQLLTCRSAYS